MKKIFFLIFCVFCSFVLCANVIVIPENAIPSEKIAAAELQKGIKNLFGKTLKIQTAAAQTPAIYIGQSPIVAQKLSNFNFADFKDDEILLKNVNGDLIITGDRPRGAIYAVYELLERQYGVRFWNASAEYWPDLKQQKFVIPQIDYRFAPPFPYRDTNFRVMRVKAFSVKMRLNGYHTGGTPAFGGNLTIKPYLVHTFNIIIPEKKYFKAHPEWFSLHNGKRVGGQSLGQLCLTNNEMREEFKRNVRDILKKNPNTKLLSISQNDNLFYCQCQNCEAINQREGGPTGSLLDFVNYIARDLKEDYPQVWVDTLAYTYSRNIPRNIRPESNVMIRLCADGCDFSRPLDAPENAKFYKQLQDWKKISPQIGIWNYIANFFHFLIPHPNMKAWGRDLRMFADNNVKMVFQETDNKTYAGPFMPLRVWLTAKLLWNPYQAQDKLINEFLAGYYGNAAPFLRQQYDLLNQIIEKSNYKSVAGVRLGMYANDTPWLDVENIIKLYKLQLQAENAVKNNPEFLKRVIHNAISFEVAVLSCGKEKISPFFSLEELRRIFDRLEQSLKETGTRQFNQRSEISLLLKNFRYNLDNYKITKSGNVPDFCKNIPDDKWTEILSNEMVTFTGRARRYNVKNIVSKQAIRMSCASNAWMIQWTVPGVWKGKKGEVYVAVRGENLAAGKPALSSGTYNLETKKGYYAPAINGENISTDEYTWHKLGEFEFSEPQYVWLAPVQQRTGDQSSIWVDRMIIIMKD